MKPKIHRQIPFLTFIMVIVSCCYLSAIGLIIYSLIFKTNKL